MEDVIQDCLGCGVILIPEASGKINFSTRFFVNFDREVHASVESLERERFINLIQGVYRFT